MTPPRSIAARPPRRGITLAEVAISTFLVGLVLVGALQSTAMVHRTWRLGEVHQLGLQLARDLMDEVQGRWYEEPDDLPVLGLEGPETGLDRSAWDDVDDYDGWSADPPEDETGTPYAGYTGWTRAVTVEYVQVADPTSTSGSDQGLKRITVTVTDPAGNDTLMVGYRSRWGALETPPAADGTIQCLVRNELDTDGGRPVRGAVNLVNNAKDQ